MKLVNEHRESTTPQHRSLHEKCDLLLGIVYLAVSSVFVRAKMLVCHRFELRSLSMEQSDLRQDRLDVEMHDTQHPWTLRTVFLATSGICVYRSKYTTGKTMKTLDITALKFLASKEPETLLPVQIVASQNPGQAGGLAKTLTCIQAVWFCSQCIARMNAGMAISLLELNTYAHCVSAFFIYGFWWHKPYDIASHAFVQSSTLDFCFLRQTLEMIHPRNGHNVRDVHFEFYACNDVHLGNVYLYVLLDPGQDSADDVTVAEGDLIPGTGFYFWESKKPRSGNRIVLLSNPSLLRWQELWHSAVEAVSSEAGEGLRTISLWPGERARNSQISGIFAASLYISFLEDPLSHLGKVTSANVAFLTYGGLHLFAWQFHFRSATETILWRIAAVLTASSGLVAVLPVVLELLKILSSPPARKHFEHVPNKFSRSLVYYLVPIWIAINMVARIYLFVESFVALPDSPPSTYQIPRWTAYIPHI
jgi:hypothetical protein